MEHRTFPGSSIVYSFPVQLLMSHLKRNQLMVLGWIILIAMVTGNFGKYLGIPYLFLDPEYMDQVGFLSFFILGAVTAGYAAAWNITGYITEGHRFAFLGALARPFTKFALNNSLLPLTFICIFVFQVVGFQINNEYSGAGHLMRCLSGFFSGLLALTALLYTYFHFTQKDIFRYVVCRLDEKLKRTVPVTRASALRKLDIARKKQIRVDNYLGYDFRFHRVGAEKDFYDKETIIRVFDQNHLNLVIIELILFVLIILLGLFKDVDAFQLPAGASFMIFLTAFVMIAGAFGYWFGGWSGTAALALFLLVNHLASRDFFSRKYQAFGLDYHEAPAVYDVKNLRHLADSAAIRADHDTTLIQLNNWRSKFPDTLKPRAVFICASGGGKRAALWTLAALQTADSLTAGNLMDHSVLITGASGGLIGASYFRELRYRTDRGEALMPYAARHREHIASDNLNPLIFSLLANDLFVGFTKFDYQGITYHRDRAFTFEDQLNRITDGLMDQPMEAYRATELSGKTPMVILTPTIVNDGRKLYIASRPVSFMNAEGLDLLPYKGVKIAGVDFNRLFAAHDPGKLRFLSALRMSATFPYITPNTTLPTQPPLLIMDAGISDNFGVSDAVRYMYAFREWINENTSGVIILSIRDSPKVRETPASAGRSIVDELTQPISSVYNNFENFQDITGDLLVGHSSHWLNQPVHRIDLEYSAMEYVPILQQMDSIRQNSARASLSWRLTTREKRGVIANLQNENNRLGFKRLSELLKP